MTTATTSMPLSLMLREQTVQGMVHDMKAPMTVLKGYLQMLLSGMMGDMKEDQRRLLQQTVGPLEDLILMTDNLLQASSLEEHTPTITPTLVDIDAMIKEVVDFYALPFNQRKMKIFSHGMARGIKLSMDAFWVKRALHNLVWNAYKFTPDGGQVTLEVRRADEGIEIVVADSGRGIPADKLPHVFEKFEQVFPEKDRKMGHGLGLWICRQVMELHGGSIHAESNFGHGTRFILHFPV